jgi:hypothetical protein
MAGTPDDLGDLGDFEEIQEQPAMADVGILKKSQKRIFLQPRIPTQLLTCN